MSQDLARWLSLALHPFIVVVLALAVIMQASNLEPRRAWGWFGIAVGTTVVPVLARILLRYWHVGSDFDIFHRNQRNTVYVLAALCMGALLVIVTVASAPPLLRGAVYAALPALLVAAVINRYTKISVHAMVMAGCGVVCALLYPVAWWLVIPLGALLGWSRVHLGRHTPWQVTLGWGVAAGSVLLAFPRFL